MHAPKSFQPLPLYFARSSPSVSALHQPLRLLQLSLPKHINAVQKKGSEDMTRLTLDKTNKKILGVCAGLANWSGIDAMIIRLIFAVATIVGFGSPVLIYILLAMILD